MNDTLIGKVIGWDGKEIILKAPFESSYLMEQQGYKEAEIRLIDGRSISGDQRKKAYALFRDISLFTGYDSDHIKGVMKDDFIAKKGWPEFSLSDVDMNTAREFIDHMVEFCLEWGVPCMDSLLDKAQDVSRYLYLCLYHKKCCICGKEAEVHHVDAVGMGRNRHTICHVGMKAMALCRAHHDEVQVTGQHTFDKLHHVYGIKLNELLVKHLNLGVLNTE